ALLTVLRAEGVTALLTRETVGFFGDAPETADGPAAVLAENVLLLRSLQARGALHRVLTVVRMRFSNHDRTIREFTITERGLTMLGRWSSEASMLEELASDAPQSHTPPGEPPR